VSETCLKCMKPFDDCCCRLYQRPAEAIGLVPITKLKDAELRLAIAVAALEKIAEQRLSNGDVWCDPVDVHKLVCGVLAKEALAKITREAGPLPAGEGE
jgi:hypothetical protein